jgi:hypothetical protein
MSLSKEKGKDVIEASKVNRVHDRRSRRKPRPNKGKEKEK